MTTILARLDITVEGHRLRVCGSNLRGEHRNPEWCRRRGLTWGSWLDIEYELTTPGAPPQRQQVVEAFLVPSLTAEESFVIDGQEFYLILQLRRAPGPFFFKRHDSLEALIEPKRGYRYRFFRRRRRGADGEEVILVLEERSLLGPSELRRLGQRPRRPLTLAEDEWRAVLDADPEGDAAVRRIARWLRSSGAVGVEGPGEGRDAVVSELVTGTHVGPYGRERTALRLRDGGSGEPVLSESDLRAVVARLRTFTGDDACDDPEHIDSYCVNTAADVASEYLARALDSAGARFKTWWSRHPNATDHETHTRLRQAFREIDLAGCLRRHASRRSKHRTNLLGACMDRRRIEKTDVRESRERRREPGPRALHWSYYGRICPVDTPHGALVGLTLSLTPEARVDESGRIVAAYHPVRGGIVIRNETEYLSATDEEKTWIAFGDQVAEDGRLRDAVQARRGADCLQEKSSAEITHIDVSPDQPFSLAARLIPFLVHDDANRALMAAGALRQAVPLRNPEAPLVATGAEASVLREAGASSASRFDVVNGTLALGRNLVVAFVPWFGWNYEDAIVVSQAAVEALTSVRRHEIALRITEEDRDWHFEIMRERLADSFRRAGSRRGGKPLSEGTIANKVSQALSHDRVKRVSYGVLAQIGMTVSPGMPLIECVLATDRGEVDPTTRITLRHPDYLVPPGAGGDVVEIEEVDNPPDGTVALFRIVIEQLRPLEIGDKICGRHGNKGVVSRILPYGETPVAVLDAGQVPIDVILNPLGIIGRQNLGQLYEAQLGWVLRNTGTRASVPAGAPGLTREDILERLDAEGLGREGRARIRFLDPETGALNELPYPATVGVMYIVKLDHHPADKIASRGIPPAEFYARTTGQPTKGRKARGGQRLGEMELWALLGHRAERLVAEFVRLHCDEKAARILLHRMKSEPRALIDGLPPPLSLAGAIVYLRGLGLSPRVYTADRDVTDEILRLATADGQPAGHGITPASEIGMSGQLRVELDVATPEEIRAWGSPW